MNELIMSGTLDLSKVSDVVAKDIIELQTNITAFKEGTMDEERFRHYRLTRGVYGSATDGCADV